ncbi:MAG TPA: ABC transporter ATP-binding protein [Steroidobacteraceae bacterium]|nr:ABC transporter ATP-binding protein [Steroidobacteraceae bacterium]
MIDLSHISRFFQVGGETVHALDDVSIRIGAGEYSAVMGPSGSGKSTLLNILGLLDRPTSGTYLLDGTDTTSLDANALARVRGERVGFIFQTFHLVSRLTALENVELPMVLASRAPAERRARAKELLQRVGLADRVQHRPDQLSGGQRQRVAIARAMIMRPAVLLADEPTGNLDSASGKDVLDALERLNTEGLTLIVVTHDQLVGDRAPRRIRMLDGKVLDDVRR